MGMNGERRCQAASGPRTIIQRKPAHAPALVRTLLALNMAGAAASMPEARLPEA
jgi:hypothetical protein